MPLPCAIRGRPAGKIGPVTPQAEKRVRSDRFLTATLALVLLAACADPPPNDIPAPPAAALSDDAAVRLEEALKVVDATDIAEQWARSCALCHGNGNGGAPLVGDVEAWRPRIATGEETLLHNTLEGLGNMPPLGYCMDCTEADFRQLIRFMLPPELRQEDPEV